MQYDSVLTRFPGYFEGPNIYMRCLNSLRSKIPAEQAYALYHLVKISYERGDKYKFESFPGLAEGLVEKALEVASIFFKVKWRISWDPYGSCPAIDELDGYEGTDDILERIATLEPIQMTDTIQPEAFADEMVTINEAVLAIRNMVTLPDNALFMSNFCPVKDLICIILRLPKNDTVAELQQSALDIAEQLTPFLSLDSSDPLYVTLLESLHSSDRGTILTALRGLGRISMNLESTNKLGGVPETVLEKVTQWLLLNDDELMDACLDFLYQYTAVVANVDNLLRSIVPENLVIHLVRLLAHGAKRIQVEKPVTNEQIIPAKEGIAMMPPDLLQEMLKIEEPGRVHNWVKCFFEEDASSFVTQLAAWQAYQNSFAAALKSAGQNQITPADFIRNSTSVYKGSKAEVMKEPGELQQKFIIKGIRGRLLPLTMAGREYKRCLWDTSRIPFTEKCGQLFLNQEELWNHILNVHLQQFRGQAGFENKELACACTWGECTKFAHPTTMRLAEFARHVNSHLSTLWPASSTDGIPSKRAPPWIIPAKTMTLTYEETMTTRDERNPNAAPQAAGIPLSAVLVLRNLARNVVKTEAEDEMLKKQDQGGETGGWNEKLFRPLLPRLFEILAENRALVSINAPFKRNLDSNWLAESLYLVFARPDTSGSGSIRPCTWIRVYQNCDSFYEAHGVWRFMNKSVWTNVDAINDAVCVACHSGSSWLMNTQEEELVPQLWPRLWRDAWLSFDSIGIPA